MHDANILVVMRAVAFFLLNANGLGAQMIVEKIPFGELKNSKQMQLWQRWSKLRKIMRNLFHMFGIYNSA